MKVSNFDEFTPVPLSPVIQNTYDLFKNGHDIKAITKETKQSKVMIITHLRSAVFHFEILKTYYSNIEHITSLFFFALFYSRIVLTWK